MESPYLELLLVDGSDTKANANSGISSNMNEKVIFRTYLYVSRDHWDVIFSQFETKCYYEASNLDLIPIENVISRIKKISPSGKGFFDKEPFQLDWSTQYCIKILGTSHLDVQQLKIRLIDELSRKRFRESSSNEYVTLGNFGSPEASSDNKNSKKKSTCYNDSVLNCKTSSCFIAILFPILIVLCVCIYKYGFTFRLSSCLHEHDTCYKLPPNSLLDPYSHIGKCLELSDFKLVCLGSLNEGCYTWNPVNNGNNRNISSASCVSTNSTRELFFTQDMNIESNYYVIVPFFSGLLIVLIWCCSIFGRYKCCSAEEEETSFEDYPNSILD